MRLLARRLVVGLEGAGLSGAERSLLSRFPPAGVILFARNVSSLVQLRDLVDEVCDVMRDASGNIPLVMADHEGGRTSVLADAIGAPPSQMAVARSGDPSLCAGVFTETARRLAACGVNTILAPDADINTEPLNPVIGTRAFGGEPAEVSRLTVEALHALAAQGLVSCIKHFPGHGDTSIDSHKALPALRTAVEILARREFLPFEAGIEAGADMVMVGHLAVEEGGLPASLDPWIVDGALRGRISFEGVVITDALEMEGVRLAVGDRRPQGARWSGGPILELVRRALLAGNDLLLFSNPVGDVMAGLEGETSGETAGGSIADLLEGERGRGAVERIETVLMKAARSGKYGVRGDATGIEERLFDDTAYLKVAERSVQVLRDPTSRLPVPAGTRCRLRFAGEMRDFENGVVRSFIDGLRAVFGDLVPGASVGPLPERQLEGNGLPGGAAAMAPGSVAGMRIFETPPDGTVGKGPLILVLLDRRPLDRAALSKLCEGVDVAAVCGWPYAGDLFPPGMTVICSYGLGAAVPERIRTLCFGARRNGRPPGV